jgi:hypothetical protein
MKELPQAKTFTPDEGRSFAKKTKSEFFRFSNAGKAFTRTFRDTDVEIFPGIFSTDPQYMVFVSDLVKRLQSRFKKTVLESGFFDSTAISTNFQELNTVAGVKSKPIGYTLVGNEEFRNEKRLASGFVKSRHELIFREFMELCYDGYNYEATGQIAKISSSGFPMFTNDVGYKLKHLNILAHNVSDIMVKIGKRDFKGLWTSYKLSFCGALSIRSQYDSWLYDNGTFTPKPRSVIDAEYAMSGGKKGLRFPAEKRVLLNGFLYVGKAANRIRIVSAKPSAYNNMGTSWFEGFRSWTDAKYPETWKHKGRSDILRKAKKYLAVMGLDVTEYDKSFPYWLFEQWINSLPITEEARSFMRFGMLSPTFYSSQGETPDPMWTGDPFDPEYYSQYVGLPSGIFFTSALGKIGFTFAMLCMIDDVTGDVLGNIDAILKHEHPVYAISNMGDDTLLHSNSDELIRRLKDRAEHSEFGMSEYFVVDIEDGVRFLGNVGYIDKSGEINLCGDMATYLGNMLVPERSINSKMRKYGVYGLLERRAAYEDNPSFQEIDGIFQATFAEHYGFNWMDMLMDNVVYPTDENIAVTSFADLEVLLDPSKLFYKYDENDISQSVLETIESNIPMDIANKLRVAFLEKDFYRANVEPFVLEEVS